MLHNHVLNKEQKQFVRTEIKDLLSCGAIEECQELPTCVSSNGCVVCPQKTKQTPNDPGFM